MPTTTQTAPATKPDQPSTKHLVVGRGLPTGRPDRRHGRPRGNRPARGRGYTPRSGAAVDSLRGVRVNAEALDTIARRVGV